MRPTLTPVTATDVLEAMAERPRAVTRAEVVQGLVDLGIIPPGSDPDMTIRRRLASLVREGLVLLLTPEQARLYRVRAHDKQELKYWITPAMAAEIDRRTGRTLPTASGQ